MKRFAIVLTLLALLALAQPVAAVDPGPVHQCGTFVSYRPADATRPGELVIGSTTFATSSGNPTPFRQVIAPGATTGSQICLDGTVVASQTTANLLTDFTVAPAPTTTTTASPAASTVAPASVAPSPSAALSVMPSTSAPPQRGGLSLDPVWLVLALVAVALLGLLIARSRRGTAP